MPKQWPPLTADEIGACLRKLGWVHERTQSTHQVWVNPVTREIAIVDVKWRPVSGATLKHVVLEQMKISREAFYGATKTTAKKIGGGR